VKLFTLAFSIADGETIEARLAANAAAIAKKAGAAKDDKAVKALAQERKALETFRARAVMPEEAPGLLAFLGYVLNFTAVLGGPAFDFREYCDAQARSGAQLRALPPRLLPALWKWLQGVAYLACMAVLLQTYHERGLYRFAAWRGDHLNPAGTFLNLPATVSFADGEAACRAACVAGAAASPATCHADVSASFLGLIDIPGSLRPAWEYVPPSVKAVPFARPLGLCGSLASAVAHPGTYRGFGEKADYLKSLGVKAVELLPIHEKPLDGTYWGYMSLNFFAPELSYASRQRWNEVTDEFKWMVEELHRRDIEVIIDVVYNHTGEGGLWRSRIEQSPTPDFDSQIVNLDEREVTSIYSYRGLDNHAYYALSADNQDYWNNTGVGNMTRCNAQPFRQLILDSLRYHVEELHVDGFRFDLAPILGEADKDYNRWAPETSVLADIVDDPVLNAWNTRVIAEPWDLVGFRLGGFPASKGIPGEGWGEWNAHFRDTWRQLLNERGWDWGQQKNVEKPFNIGGEYWNGSGWQKDQPGLGEAFTGSAGVYAWNGRRPVHSLNFLTVHDGFTLYDLFSFDTKRNQCSPLNQICCESPYSPFCDPDSGETNNHSRNWGDEGTKRQMVRNAFAAMLLSQGTPLILGGDEWMRTQLGNNNAYTTTADNAWNWFDWGAWEASDERHRMKDFVTQLTRFRREHAYALAPEQYGASAPFSWKSPANTDAVDWKGKAVMVHFHDRTRGPELALLFNLADNDVTFTLPSGRTWARVVDTQKYFDTDYLSTNPGPPRRSYNVALDAPEPINGGTYGVKGKSIVVLEAK